MTDPAAQPDGDLLLRTLAMPADTNLNGGIFGGWIVSQMDIVGGILAKETAQGHTVVVCSMTIKLEVRVNPVLREQGNNATRFLVTEAVFTYVAIDENGNKRPVR